MTYALTSPGGSWDGDDVGDYLATLVAAEVTDTAGTPVTAGALGGFRVLIGRTLVVTNAADSGPGSLRAALAEAGRITPSTDSVTFDPAFFGTARTILLTSGQLGASDSVAIVGPGAALLTIDGGGVHRGMQFSAAAAGTLDVSNSGLTVTNCTSGGKGTVGAPSIFSVEILPSLTRFLSATRRVRVVRFRRTRNRSKSGTRGSSTTKRPTRSSTVRMEAASRRTRRS